MSHLAIARLSLAAELPTERSKYLWHTGAKIRDGCQDQNFLRLLNEQTNLTNKVREFFVRSVRMIE